MAQNSVFVIQPYKYLGLWVFDDEKFGLIQEPFVSGADDIIERFVANIDAADAGFTLMFSANPFPGHNAKFVWRREETGGNWYYVEELDMEGWLCPALFKYFEKAPATLYAQFIRKAE